jgi:PST family polysaccharide transporter
LSHRLAAMARPLAPLTAPAANVEPAAALTAKARKGTHAMLATRVLSILVTFISITIYARLISPADYGVWAVASFSLGIATIFREMGLSAAVVQARNLTPAQQDTYFWTSVAVSAATAVALALAAPLLARLYDAPFLSSVLWVCSASLVLAGIGHVPAALLRRDLEYNKLALVEAGGMVCGLITGLAAAYLWRNVWALVAGYIAGAMWMSSSAWLLSRWLPRAPSRMPAKINLAFSLELAWYNVLTYAANNIGTAAAYRFSAADLGFFNRAQQLYSVGCFSFLKSITEVGFSLLCRLNAEAAYTHAYVSLARRVAVVFIPCAAVLPIVSADLILVLLGPAWAPATPILMWLTPAILGGAFASLFAQLMMSQGRGRELRRWAVADLALRAGGAVMGSHFGIVGLAAGFSLAVFLTVPLMVWIAGRSGPVKLPHQLVAVWPGVLLGAVAALAAALGLVGAQALSLSAGWRQLLFVGGSAALAWAALCLALPPARDALLGRSTIRA